MACEAHQLFSWDTEYSADSAEFCPVASHHNYLAVGTYQLADPEQSPSTCQSSSQVNMDSKMCTANSNVFSEEGPQDQNKIDVPKRRLGRLYLHKITSNRELTLIQRLDMPAVLDMKWCPHKIQGHILLAVANAIGQVLLYTLKASDEEVVLNLLCSCDISDDDALALSVDWSTSRLMNENPLLTVSDSKGNVNLLQLTNEKLTFQQSFLAHEFEAWITAFDYWNSDIVYSGGDDCKLRKFDIRMEPANPVMTSRSHSAGVTSIHSNKHKEFMIASGSYDETVNLWDTRKFKNPVSSQSLGGGVWRLKFEPQDGNLLLAACMHNGFHVVDTTEDLAVKASFMGHQSLAYGADWCWIQDFHKTVASASFYDHLLCLWEFTNILK